MSMGSFVCQSRKQIELKELDWILEVTHFLCKEIVDREFENNHIHLLGKLTLPARTLIKMKRELDGLKGGMRLPKSTNLKKSEPAALTAPLEILT